MPKAQPAPKKPETQKYKVLKRGVRILGHVPYARGEIVTLTDRQARYPLMSGAIGPEDADLPVEPKSEAKTKAETKKAGK